MKKKTLWAFTGIFLLSIFCFQTQAQNKKKEKDIKKINFRYTGELTKEDLENSPSTKRWFTPRYDKFNPKEDAMETIKENINDYKIVMFMGTWCPDSHREVPKFYKILEDAGYDMDQLEVYALAHGMKSEEGYEKGLNITNVPTLIFYKDDEEVNRFVEHARETAEKDIAKIVSGEEYKHYHEK